jgi:ABC-2 type transport system permease protein
MGEISEVVREGEFDRYLTRPVDPLLQLITRRFNLTVIGDLIGGVALIVAGASQIDVAWTTPAVGYLIIAVLAGALVEASMHLTASALSFRLITTQAISGAIDQLLSTLGGYPQKIFPLGFQLGLAFVFPLAFIAYFPATVLLGRTDELAVPGWLAALSPAVGLLLLLAAYAFWRSQIRHYASTGH